jgi:CTP-dependent riboflavin kinase
VVQYIGSLREEKLKKYEVTYDRHVAELGKIREAALNKGAFSAATNAEKNRGMAAGLYIDRKIIKTGKIEELSEAELEAKMKKILEDYAPILNAKQVEALPDEVTEVKETKK